MRTILRGIRTHAGTMTSGRSNGRCVVCLSDAARAWFDKNTVRGVFGISRCRVCGSAFVYPRPEEHELEHFYRAETYRAEGGGTATDRLEACLADEVRYPNSTIDAERILARCAALTRGRRFLDVGAGFGFCSRQAAKQGFEVTALEPAPRCREVFALLNGFDAAPFLLTADFAQFHSSGFDVVLMSQVLEHLPDLDAVLNRVRELLATGGIAAIAVPHFRSAVSVVQGRHDMFIDPPEHLNFFTMRGLERLFERNGFECLASETISRFDRARLTRRIPAAGRAVSAALHGALAVADRIGKGMYINAYFRKI